MLNEHVARRGLMFALSSPSGAGKSTIASLLAGVVRVPVLGRLFSE